MGAEAAEAVADSEEIRVERHTDAPWTLSARSPTLNGTISVRAARACPPLVAGNAFGLVLSPTERVRVRRGLRRVEIEPAPLRIRTRGTRAVEAVFATGLSVSTDGDERLAIGRAYNRRDRRVTAHDAPVSRGAAIEVTLRFAIGLSEEILVGGEVACVAGFRDDVSFATEADAARLLRAHVGFFDDAYFEGKRGKPTLKYRDTSRGREDADGTTTGLVVAHVGGAPPVLARGDDGVIAIGVAADVDVRLAFHGERVEAAFDPLAVRALQERARRIDARARALLGIDRVPTGALKYFTTYVTPHAPGDPHVFLKPAVLAGGPAGALLVVDGPDAEGLEGFRGVTEADWFHAMPAVGEMVGARATVRAGALAVRARFADPRWARPRLTWVR